MTKNYLNDTILLEELKKRSDGAYKYFYTSTRARLFVLAFSILDNEEMAKDVLQEFYTDFWERKLYENVSVSLKAYIYTAVKNRAIQSKKDHQYYLKFLENVVVNQWSETPRYFENDELAKKLESAVRNLPPMAGRAFRMHYIKHLSHIEIANSLGISKATVANHIHRALTGLRAELKKKLHND